MKSILITIAISVYMTFTVVTIQVANKQTLATSDVTLDIVEVMTRAFDEGGEGGHSVNSPCADCLFGSITCEEHIASYDGSDSRPGQGWRLARYCLAPGCEPMWISPELTVDSNCTFNVNPPPN